MATALEEEEALVESWHLKELAASEHLPSEEVVMQAHENTRAALEAYIAATSTRKPVRRLWPLAAAAAAAILIIYAGIRFYAFMKQDEWVQPAVVRDQQPVPAGRDGAVLTLADGSQLLLDSVANGFITTQNGSSLSLQEGQLLYEKGGTAGGESSFNTVSTPAEDSLKWYCLMAAKPG